MPNKMLIDASHREETRVVVTRGNRVEEFDFESQDKKQLRGNIYLARVTRVEPSLQAAFVEYGGNRHGFLAFSEIHPDYYQIPIADRQAILRAEAEAAAAEEEDEEEGERPRGRRSRGRSSDAARPSTAKADQGVDEPAANADEFASSDELELDAEAEEAEEGVETIGGMIVAIEEFAPEAERSDAGEGEAALSDALEGDAASSDAGEGVPAAGDTVSERADQPVEEADEPGGDETAEERNPATKTMLAEVEADIVSEPAPDAPEAATGGIEEVAAVSSDEVESVGAEDALEEVHARRRTPRRHYKIQEVIKRRQILLVQVVKEERGNKGAALTTYLSLAGRYSVLMPNTARGGGISRKITSAQDRKRLKDIVRELDVPQGMGVILRTAGENRTKPEIKRDYEYLMRMWETVRSTTLKSVAPALVYEEGSLIKRSVRDLYNKEIDEILVAGENGYREAKDFMRMLMPSHSKVVQPYRDPTPIFAKNGIEAQLDRMLQPQVTLKSGGYLVINQTEALVSIDVNSGRSTREHNIEDTALHTNLEAAEEVSRQLRLRDLAGLIVIDFIDMEEHRNNRAVEKKLKDCLKNDRARIQVGRISHFGLLEMSRQRMRTSVLESTTKPCPHCGGTGHVRSDSSVALMVVRAIEEALLKDARFDICVKTPAHTAFHLLNGKRGTLSELEKRFSVSITIEADETVGAQHYTLTRGAMAEKPPASATDDAAPPAPPMFDEPEEAEDALEEAEDHAEDDEGGEEEAAAGGDDAASNGDRKRRRRRRRRGGRGDREQAATTAAEAQTEAGDETDEPVEAAAPVEALDDDAGDEAGDGDEADGRKRRRGKRGGRRNRREGTEAGAAEASDVPEQLEGPEQIEGVEPVDEQARLAVEEASGVLKPAGEAEVAEASTFDADAEEAVPGSETEEDGAAPTAAGQAGAADDALIALPSGGDGALQAPEADAESGNGERRRVSRRRGETEASGSAEPLVSSQQGGKPVEAGAEQPKRAGWWQRKSFF